MTEPPPEPPPQLQAALEYAARGIAVVPSHFPVPAGGAGPRHPSGTLACSCGRADCPTPARHPIWTTTAEDATLETVCLVQWWVGMPNANVATPAGASFDLIEICHPAPTSQIVRWLAMQGIGAGPVVGAGPAHHQFLVAAGAEGWSFAMTQHGGLARLGGGGGLILLPPSRLVDGAVSGWLRPLGAAPLPDGARIYEGLATLPGAGELAGSVGDPRSTVGSPLGSALAQGALDPLEELPSGRSPA
jgi:hypothetical protein